VIEGDHGSAYFYPESDAAQRAIQCQVELQKRAGGNAMIGRSLFPLLRRAGFDEVHISPRMVYVDSGKPELVDGFTRKTFTAMIEGIRDSALMAGLIEQGLFDQGIKDLYRTPKMTASFVIPFSRLSAESLLCRINLKSM
jgi:hypothetical protein